MKIDPNLIIGNTQGGIPHSKPVSGCSFEDVLSAVEGSPGAHSVKLHGPVPRALVPNPYKITALTVSEEALDLLDGYTQVLANPGSTLRSLSPMVDQLERAGERISTAAAMLSDEDPLKAIMMELTSTLSSEVIRFRRGDLLS
ncbi:MAG TPA: hypothetical protein ENN34_09160 [Deltaproteobacteria bacterium]|nr:hypothetical protein [Desulfomonilia bacterium]HDP25600.1 hypothetical protein [Deltaproteobacteria bacterium]